MGTVMTRGFTIIELMLFLGISGVLFAALMIGSNNAIAQQRYRESVRNYSALLQNQYSEVLNTRNERTSNWQCVEGVVTEDPVSGMFRGTSDCVLLGKAIEIIDDGKSVEVTSVIGYKPLSDVTVSLDDMTMIKAYGPARYDNFDANLFDLGWDTTLTNAVGEVSTASYLILRSPVSGLLRVFASNNPLPSNLSEMITVDDATRKIASCIRGESGLLPTQSVTVDPTVAGPNGISINEVDDACA